MPTAAEVIAMAKIPPSAENRATLANSAAPSKAAPARRTTRLRMWALTAVAVLGLSALALPRFQWATADAPTDVNPAPAEHAADVVPPVQPAQASRAHAAATTPSAVSAAGQGRILREPATKAPASKAMKHRIAESTKSAALVSGPVVIDVPQNDDAATKPVASESKTATSAPASTSGEILGRAPVTITGCLEVSISQDEFRLTDIEGADAPKSRSWRTGFLKKRPTPVALIAPPDPQDLQKQAGRRVSATGLMTNRDLRVSSLRVVGPSCE
jgi:hypothetical protein